MGWLYGVDEEGELAMTLLRFLYEQLVMDECSYLTEIGKIRG